MRLRSLHPLMLVVALGSAVAAAPAGAAPAAVRGSSAEQYVAAANRAFRAGEYDRALAELEVGYAIEPRREFLITFAQVYAAMGRLEDAIDRCERYLAVAPASPLAGSVRQLVRGWRRQQEESAAAVRLAARGALAPARANVPAEMTGTDATLSTAAAAKPVAPKPVAPRSVVSAALAPDEATAASDKSMPEHSAAPRRDHRRRVTWMLIGGAAVVVVGVSLGVGLGLGLRDNAPATKLGAIPFH